MMNTNRTLKLTTLALCGVINILGGTIALLLRLPITRTTARTIIRSTKSVMACTTQTERVRFIPRRVFPSAPWAGSCFRQRL